MNIETIFEFIRFSIDEHAPAFHPADDVDWQEIYDFGRKQSIVGVLFQGVARLPKDFQADRKVRLKWFMQAEKIRKKNERMNKEAVELYNMLLKDGFRSCVLKGQAVACLYPDPYLRSAGDIDIWVDADRDAIVKYVTNHFPKQKQRYIHIDFPVFKKTMVEVHYTPSYMYAPWSDRKLQKWFAENADEQFRHVVSLPGASGEVCAPSLAFNRIFMLSHIYKHLFSEGIGLRQIMDYYYVLQQGFTQEENRRDHELLKQLNMYGFAKAVMYVLQYVFGLSERLCVVEPDRKSGEFLMSEILQAGNFGHFDERFGNTSNETVAHRYFRMTRRNMHFVGSYPAEALCEPVFRTLYFCWKKLHGL